MVNQPKHLLRAIIRIGDVTVGIGDADCIPGLVDCLKPVVDESLAPGLVAAAAGTFESPSDRAFQAFGTLFENIVGCTVLKCLHNDTLIDGVGEKHQRNFWIDGPNLRQDIPFVQTAMGKIRKDEVDRTRVTD